MAVDAELDDDLSPAERRRRKVRDAIVEAAEAIFTEEGEAGISMRRIAERIDYSPAALYKYFDSKEALFDEIREQFFERLYRRMVAVEGMVTEGPLVCEECLRAYVETGLEQPAHYRLAFSSWFESKLDDRQDSYGYAASERLELMIEKAIVDGWFRECDPVLAGLSVWAGAHGLTMLAVTIPDFPGSKEKCADLTLDDLIAFHAEMTGRGLATPKLNAWLDARKPKK
ncbi:MAG: TetR/AcrR family transcriptional regulator [Caulobacterales bacterium]|uniref:TetR/AcrR family transcriptional regulator n=1 Tax=Glycocaulis sp. TaxID=1969725 RepID=UPI003FA01295